MIHTHISKVKWLFSLLLAFTVSAQGDVSFLFVGDVMQHDGQINAAYNKTSGDYEYSDGFKFVKPIINQYDFSVANLEVTLAGKPYKGYPQFSAPDQLAETLVQSGFNVIITANNHSCDRGAEGVVRTLDVLDKLGVKHTGTFRSQEERDKNYPLMLEKNGMKIAMLNYTYGTNGLFVKAPLIVNYIDSAVIRKDVARAKELKADLIVCNMHWGTEYKSLPNDYQKRYESFCYELGVDMVIGNHPHVIQPIENKQVAGKDRLTVWSLGNFVSNMQVRYTRGGVMLGAHVKKTEDKIDITKAEDWLVYVYKRQEGPVMQYYILPDYDYNAMLPGFIPPAELAKMQEFFQDSRELYEAHNKNVKEKLVTEYPAMKELYQKYLKSYYAVHLTDANDDLLLDPNARKYLHCTLDDNGVEYVLSGVCDSIEQAEGNARFIMDCGLSKAVKIVKVSPDKVEEIQR
ncbi:MAG: CapA family protein [Bacteroidetes bacterium]|nr:MAG: CapA family protein [Bacteroidota bacterium]